MSTCKLAKYVDGIACKQLHLCRLLGQEHDAWKEYNTAIALAEHKGDHQTVVSSKVCLYFLRTASYTLC